MISRKFTRGIIKNAMQIHTALGPGLLESAYQECLCYNLQKEGYSIEKEKPMPLVFEDIKLECGYRIDIVVENKLVLELINFNVAHLRDGIKRVINSGNA